ncbi:MAG TPA: hypothetical protein VGT44_03230 [Ktedonobacteraceae bacterium]|nr:hypothetical protein [Ktedonobacteraceae bacterium]
MQPDDQFYNSARANGSPDRSSRSLRARRTSPALPGITMPTAPIVPSVSTTPVSSTGRSIIPSTPSPRGGGQAPHRQQPARRAAWKLLASGILLALVTLLLYPLLAGALPSGNAAGKSALAVLTALTGLFLWIPRLYWTAWPPATSAISHLPMFDVSQPGGFANLLLLGLVIAGGLYLMAVRVARNVGRERLTDRETHRLFWIIFTLAALFALLYLFAPAVMSQDALLYGLYGRMVSLYHVNPYVAPVTIPPGDVLHGVLVGQIGRPPFGPVWMDVSLAVALTAQGSAATILFDFRLLALVIHLVNALLLWNVLARLRPEARFTGMVLYAWNPAVLLLGIGEMHLDLVVIFFVLLAILFFQRRALVLCWVCLLLSALIQPLSLLLFPLFIRLMWKATRSMSRRAVWWLMLIGVSALVVALAYAPYYAGWSVAGIAGQLRLAFAPGVALDSLDAAIQHLRFGVVPVVAWLAAPLTWTIFAALVVGCLLLLGLWLTENLEYALLFTAWVCLAILVISPSYLAWSALLPLALAICSASARTTLFALLLAAGALLSYYFNLNAAPWDGQGLVTLGLPVLIWGWSLFFSSTMHMTRAGAEARGQSSGQLPAIRPTRGPRFSRPSWPGRR